MRRRLAVGSIAAGVLAACALLLTAGASATGQSQLVTLQRVTVIGDSVAFGLSNYTPAREVLRQGIDLRLEVAVCRRVDQTSCPSEGGPPPPNVVELVKERGTRLGKNVVVAVGYNDYEAQYAKNIETALAALKAAGVERVWWLTLRATRHSYLNMNDDVAAAALRHPELEVIDWNVYSRSHPDWFQSDGLHLVGPGAEGMATLIHKTLLADGIAIKSVRVVTATLPTGHRGKPYSAKLVARLGAAPYSWSLLAQAPKGIHLLPSGVLTGKPRVTPGTYRLVVKVKDVAGTFATRRVALRVVA